MKKYGKIHYAVTFSIGFTLGWFITAFWFDPPLETWEAITVVVFLIVALVLHILEGGYVESGLVIKD
jgi:membrane-bound metal-dependent hydrolase YbcI (DUF457 family)